MRRPTWQLRTRWLALLAALLAAATFSGGTATAAPTTPFVMGTEQEETSFSGMWMRRIYVEAFKRLDIPLEIPIYPLKRLSAMVDEGQIDGEMLRVHAYASAHPNLVRVEESPLGVTFSLWGVNPGLSINRLDELASKKLLGEYRRGVAICENTLKSLMPTEQLSDVTTAEQALRKLQTNRTDFFCENENTLRSLTLSPEFRNAAPVHKLIDIAPPTPLYPYLHKKNAALAPRLAAVLKQMKAEGLIEKFRRDVERELSAAR